MRKILLRLLLIWIMAMGSAQAGDDKGTSPPLEPQPDDMELIAVMEILKLMDLAKEMDMVKEMEHLVEDKQNVSTTD